jgi:hypothetical protein
MYRRYESTKVGSVIIRGKLRANQLAQLVYPVISSLPDMTIVVVGVTIRLGILKPK